ncbi:S1 family peptidase [Zhihengliuella flava]|uniref:Peptidase S1 domain-containing protein n=1 Tax=Zhihengliuella flava TaxID=1285193 RepID=A0A931D7F9_9MICC|nr:S1 family peptidase [Zhihengliuella flava]MBG6085075.1 hypothetical protein [Zhihengliuella flava]
MTLTAPTTGTAPSRRASARARLLAAAASFTLALAGALPAAAAPTPDPDPRTDPDVAALAEAVERDLGTSLDQFLASGELTRVAAQLQRELEAAGLAASVAVQGGRVSVRAADGERDAVVRLVRGSAPRALDDGGVVVHGPAAAEPAPEDDPVAAERTAVSARELAREYVAQFGPAHVHSVTQEPGGFVISTADVATEPAAVERFAAGYTNVRVEAAAGPAVSYAADDVVGGMPYGHTTNGVDYEVCSTGFAAFSPQGQPAVLSAGHCTVDGSITQPLSLLDQGGIPGTMVGTAQRLGTFGFSQFGGVSNSSSSLAGDNVGTDVSVIEAINPELTLLPRASDWSAAPEMTTAGPWVTDVADPVAGAEVCKSGRATGWTCSTITEVGVFFLYGHQFPQDPEDIRASYGFIAEGLESAQGDSGGPIVSGTVGVGLLSGGPANPDDGAYSLGTSLTDALSYTGGYTVHLHLPAPVLEAGVEYDAGAPVGGTVSGAAAGTHVRVEAGGRELGTVPVGADGAFVFDAPADPGEYALILRAVNGYSESEPVTASIVVAGSTAPPTPDPTPTPETSTTAPRPTPGPSSTTEPAESARPTPTGSARPSTTPTGAPSETPASAPSSSRPTLAGIETASDAPGDEPPAVLGQGPHLPGTGTATVVPLTAFGGAAVVLGLLVLLLARGRYRGRHAG